MSVRSLLVGFLSFASIVNATPTPQVSFGNANGKVTPGTCQGQSCDIADAAGSTGNLPKKVPVGSNDKGWKCVGKYNPEGYAALMQIKGQTKSKGAFGKGRVLEELAGVPATILPAMEKRLLDIEKRQLFGGYVNKYTGACKKNILVFAKGTTETGEMGITVGPLLKLALNGRDWNVVGVQYPANFDGNYCAGLPGGMAGKELLESAADKCPNAKLFLSGYSQGAMSVRNSVAYARDDVKPRVKGVLTYGDPFNGAQIKGWTGPILTYCRESDGVCQGQFKIGGGHLAYSTSSDVSNGVAWLKKIAAQS